MEIIYTKEPEWLKKWDEYILHEDKASHLLLSDWVNSFCYYGFDYEIVILVQNNNILGGYTAVIAKAVTFKFYIVPYGPIVSKSFENHLNELISTIPKRGVFFNCCYAHITLPVVINSNNIHVYNALPELPILKTANEGHFFKYVYSSNGLNWLNLENFSDEEMLLNSFRASVRRYIRSSQRKELELKFLEDEKDIKIGYDLCLENARLNKYSLRDWSSFRETLVTMIANNSAKFLGAFNNGDIKGAALIIKAGKYYTYILGGTIKEKPDFLAGHFLHWEAIKLSFKENLSGYNISLGGSKGVVDLKNSYADEQIYFENSKYHWVLKPVFFKTYLFFEKKMKPHKKNISRIIAKLK